MSVTLKKNSLYIKQGGQYQNIAVYTAPKTIEKWLQEHPEVTTSVQDKSITPQKIADSTKEYLENITDKYTANVIAASVSQETKKQVEQMQIKEGQTVIDATLTVSGAAADAKATGEIGTSLNELYNTNHRNILDPSQVTGTVVDVSKIDKDSFNVSSKSAGQHRYAWIDFELIPGALYTFSGMKHVNSGVGCVAWRESDTSGSGYSDVIQLIKTTDSDDTIISASFTPTKPYVRIVFFCTYATSENGSVDFSYSMLEVGRHSYYIPYKYAADYYADGEIDLLKNEAVNTVFNKNSISITAGSDFDDFKTPGNYYVATFAIANTLLHAPIFNRGYCYGGRLTVYSLNDAVTIMQTYDTAEFAYRAWRVFNGSSWGAWKIIAVDSDITSLQDAISELKVEDTSDKTLQHRKIPNSNFNLANGIYLNGSDTTIKALSTGYILYFECQPNSQYCIIKRQDLRFAVGYVESLPAVGVKIKDYHEIMRTSAAQIEAVDTTKFDILNISTGENAKYIVCYYCNMADGAYINDADTQLAQLRANGIIYATERNYVTPEDFGIEANDEYENDMSARFTVMVNYIADHEKIRTIFIPSGKYYGTINIPATMPGIEIKGTGKSSVLSAGRSWYKSLRIFASQFNIHDLSVISGNIDPKGESLTDYFNHDWEGILINNASYGFLRNIWLDTLDDSIILESAKFNQIDNIFITHTVQNPAFVDIDNTDPSDPDNPGRKITYSQNNRIALYPYIHEARGFRISQSYENMISNVIIRNAGCGIWIGAGTAGNKFVNIQMEFLGGYGIMVNHVSNQFVNIRIDSAGQYDEHYAVYVGDPTHTYYNKSRLVVFDNLMIQHSSHGGIRVDEKVMFFVLRNGQFLNNSSWYKEFKYFELPIDGDNNPDGWEASPEVFIGTGVTRSKFDVSIIGNVELEKTTTGEWTGHSGYGIYFENNGSGEYTQDYNDINVLFGYDLNDPDGDTIISSSKKESIIQYNTIPSTKNSIVWNCEKIN